MGNMEIWNAIKRPPESALRPITAGRLKGKSDINPQWRLQALTEQFGICGIGWKYEIVNMFSEQCTDNIVAVTVQIALYVNVDGKWSEAIPGVGGSQLIQKEKAGPYVNDEAYKMALTDALSVAGKQIGLAADIYAGLWDGAKFIEDPNKPKEPITEEQASTIRDLMESKSFKDASGNVADTDMLCARLASKAFGVASIYEIPSHCYDDAIKAIEDKAKKEFTV